MTLMRLRLERCVVGHFLKLTRYRAVRLLVPLYYTVIPAFS